MTRAFYSKQEKSMQDKKYKKYKILYNIVKHYNTVCRAVHMQKLRLQSYKRLMRHNNIPVDLIF